MIDLRLGDCLDVMRSIEAGSIDAVVTDPPYGMDWDTDSTRYTSGRRGHRTKDRGLGRDDWGDVPGDAEPFDPSPWLAYPKVILFGANHFAAALPVGTTLVWVKRTEDAYGSFLSDAEIAWMKGGHGVYLHRDQSFTSWTKERCHPTQKPVGLMKWCLGKLRLPPGATVLDPYMGSGTTGIAADELGFNFIGIESDPVHFATAQRRLARQEARYTLFERPTG